MNVYGSDYQTLYPLFWLPEMLWTTSLSEQETTKTAIKIIREIRPMLDCKSL